LDASTGTGTGFDIGAAAGVAVKVTNASAAFQAGAAGNVINWTIRYHTLLVIPD
jgi:hypothetical protein